MGAQDSIDKYVQKYRERLDFLKEAYKNKEYHDLLDKRYKELHPDGHTSFGLWLSHVEYEFEHDLQDMKKTLYPKDYFLHFEKRDITLFYNDVLVQQGQIPYSRKVYFSSVNKWDKPYLKRTVGTPIEKDCDFFSVDVTFLFRSTITPDEARELIKTNKKLFGKDSLDAAYERLQGNKKYKNISKDFLQVKKVLYRSGFKELIITIGLKDSILQLKEKMQEELSKKYEI